MKRIVTPTFVALLLCAGCPADPDPAETATQTETGDGDGDPTGDGDGDGDASCDPAAFVGAGIGEDGWGVGSFCDQVSTCIDAGLVTQALLDLGIDCLDPGPDSPCPEPDSQAWCIYDQGDAIDQAFIDRVCASLELGVEQVACLVFGP